MSLFHDFGGPKDFENLMPGKGWGKKELSQGSSLSFPAKKPFPLFLVTLPSGV